MLRQLEARVRSVHRKGGMPLRSANQLVPPGAALWEWAPGSGKAQARPAAFELGAAPAVLSLQVEAPGAGASAGYELRGTHDGVLLFAGSVQGGQPEGQPLQVDVTARAEPGRFQALAGDIHWELLGADGAMDAGRTMLELYWVPAETCRPFPRGLPVELLRELGRALAPAGARKRLPVDAALPDGGPGTDVRSVVQWCFSRNPPLYDSEQGENHFTYIPNYPRFDEVTLYLSRYLNALQNPSAVCNCYDQAAVLQFYLRTIGVAVTYCYMAPFGYLAESDLIGRGLCNNPFYLHFGNDIIVPETDPRRSGFGNHAFCQLESQGHIADSCAGPHYGDQSVSDYLAQATDGTTPTPPKIDRGTPEDIRRYKGVTHVDVLLSGPRDSDALEAKPRRAFKSAVGFDDRAMPTAPGPGVACAWPDPRLCPALSPLDWELGYEEVLAGPREALRFWRLRNGGTELSISIYVASDDSGTARHRFVTLGSTHQMPGPVFTQGPAALGHSAAMYRSARRHRYLWVFHNVTFDVMAANPREELDVEALALWLQQQAEAALVTELSAHLPPIRVTPQPGATPVGDTVTLGVDAGADALLQPLSDAARLRLVDESAGTLTFRVESPGVHEVTVVAVDPRTLLVSSQGVKVSTP